MQGAHKTFQPIFGQQTDPERTPNLQNQKLVTHRTRFFLQSQGLDISLQGVN